MRGVSAWNFDVAALKSNAAMEGATELATVPEVPGRLPPCRPVGCNSINIVDIATQ